MASWEIGDVSTVGNRWGWQYFGMAVSEGRLFSCTHKSHYSLFTNFFLLSRFVPNMGILALKLGVTCTGAYMAIWYKMEISQDMTPLMFMEIFI